MNRLRSSAVTLAEQLAAWETALKLAVEKTATPRWLVPVSARHDERWWQERSFTDSAPGTARSGTAGADDHKDIPAEGEGSGEAK